MKFFSIDAYRSISRWRFCGMMKVFLFRGNDETREYERNNSNSVRSQFYAGVLKNPKNLKMQVQFYRPFSQFGLQILKYWGRIDSKEKM